MSNFWPFTNTNDNDLDFFNNNNINNHNNNNSIINDDDLSKILNDYIKLIHTLKIDLTNFNPKIIINDNNNLILLEKLNSKFIDRILLNSNFLNELMNKQNNLLLDFLSIGFFYDFKNKKFIKNLDYLIDNLLNSINFILNNNNNDNDSIDFNFHLNKITIISEIFSINLNLLLKLLVNSNFNLNNIWSILYLIIKNSNSNSIILISNIFIKINLNFLSFQKDNYLNFIRNKSDFTNILLNLININSISRIFSDFFIKIILTDKINSPTGIIDLLINQNFINKFFLILKNSNNNDNNLNFNSDFKLNLMDFINNIIIISSSNSLFNDDNSSIGPNNLIRLLVLPKNVNFIIYLLIHSNYSNDLININIIISILIELIRKNNSDYYDINYSKIPSNRDPIYLGFLLKKFSLVLPILTNIIFNDNGNSTFNDTEIDFPISKKSTINLKNFKFMELIAELLHCSNMSLINSKKFENFIKKRNSRRNNLLIDIDKAMKDLQIIDDNNNNEFILNNDIKKEEIDNSNSNSNLNIDEKENEIISNENLIYDFDDLLEKNDIYNFSSDNFFTKSLDNIDLTPDLNIDMHIKLSNTTSTNNDTTKNNSNVTLNNNNTNSTSISDSDSDFDFTEDEEDKSFEIPFISENQNFKLRSNPTIGDLFKINLFDSGIILKSISLFIKHPWNNFWHNVVFDIIHQIFNGRMDFTYNSFLVFQLFNFKKSLIFKENSINTADINDQFIITEDFILKGYKNSFKFYQKSNMNLGYMGHLVLIAEEIIKFSKLYKVELISTTINNTLLKENWVIYSEEILNETRIMYSKILGGGKFVDDGNGNIIPQLPDPYTNNNINETEIDFTELDLHKKIGIMLFSDDEIQGFKSIKNSQEGENDDKEDPDKNDCNSINDNDNKDDSDSKDNCNSIDDNSNDPDNTNNNNN